MSREDIATMLEAFVRTLRTLPIEIHWPIVIENARDENLGLFLVMWERHGPGRTVTSFKNEAESVTFKVGDTTRTATRRVWKREGGSNGKTSAGPVR